MSNKIKCNDCGRVTPQTERGQATETEIISWGELDHEQEISWINFLFQCDVCSSISLQCFSPDISEDFFQLFPVVKNLNDVPAVVQNSYSEAVKVKNISPLAFSSLIRRSLEYVCIEQNAEGKDLYAKLEDLSRKGIIPDTLARMSHAIRSFGNIGAHAKDTTVGKDEVQIIDDIFLAILEYVYIAPQKLKKAEEHLKPKGVAVQA